MTNERPSGNLRQDYRLLDADEIRQGFEGVKPGWAMGSFYPVGDLQHSNEFEIKEWDRTKIRSDWADHVEIDREYIVLLQGILTVVLGRHAASGIEELAAIEVRQGQRIILRAGVWRKFHGTDDVMGVTIRTSPNAHSAERLERYRSITEHWKHADQIRQWLLYNSLMVSSVLVAAWSALYAQHISSVPLFALVALGCVTSIAWLSIVRRASGYYDMYENDARAAEKEMLRPLHWPFHRRAEYRSDQTNGDTFKFSHLTQVVPVVFFVFYVVAFYLSIERALSP
jgi:hypothetical protein